MERETGIEPATNSLEGCDSTTELLPPTRRCRAASAWSARPPCSCASRPSPSLAPTQARQRPSRLTPAVRLRPMGQAKAGGQGRIRTSVALGRQIYSLLRLTAPPPARISRASRHLPLDFARGILSLSKGGSQARSRSWPLERHAPTNSPARQRPLRTRLNCEDCPRCSRPSPRAARSVRWSWRRDLNPRPADYKSAALPD